MFLEYLKFLSIGILGGIISGLLGIGGGVVVLPILLYITGIEIRIATAISTINVFFASSFGTFFCWWYKTINFRYALAFGLSSAATSFLGSYFTELIPELIIKIIYLASAILALIFFFFISRNNSSQHEIELAISKTPTGKDYFKIISISIFAGFIFGVIGVGGGFLYVPILIILFGLPIKIAIGTSLLIMLLNAIPGLIGKLLTVRFDIFVGLAVAIGAIGGARLGTYFHKKIKDNIIRIIFIVLLIVIIARVGFDLYSSLI